MEPFPASPEACVLLAPDRLESILKSIHIPPCPEVLVALMEEMRQAEVDFLRLTELISLDVGLAASMLKTANSPFFAPRNKIDSIQHAVSVLGIRNLTQVLRGAALQKVLGGDRLFMQQFWEGSNLSALIASNMAAQLGDISRDDAYTLGLFHDCGIPIMMQKFPDYQRKLAAQSNALVMDLEEQYYGTNHAVVGNLLTRNWHLPDPVSQAILVHHDYTIYTCDLCVPEVCALVATIQMTEHIAADLQGRTDSAEWQKNGRMAMQHLGLSAEDMENIAENALADLEAMRTRC